MLIRCRRAGKKREAESPQLEGSSRDAMQEIKKRKKHTRRAEAVNKAVDTAVGDTMQNKKAPKGLLDMPAGKCPVQHACLLYDMLIDACRNSQSDLWLCCRV